MQSEGLRACVLVVDDETMLRMFAVDLLGDHGFDTIEAADGVEALAALHGHPEICVLLTDINMPGEPDGLGLAHEARARWPNMQIVVTSGRILPNATEMPVRSSFIGKPYTGQQLLAAISAS